MHAAEVEKQDKILNPYFLSLTCYLTLFRFLLINAIIPNPAG